MLADLDLVAVFEDDEGERHGTARDLGPGIREPAKHDVPTVLPDTSVFRRDLAATTGKGDIDGRIRAERQRLIADRHARTGKRPSDEDQRRAAAPAVFKKSLRSMEAPTSGQ